MRRKYLIETYMKDVLDSEIKIEEKDDHFLCVKKIKKVSNKFITKQGLCLIDDGYFIVEVLPKNKNYSMRVFLDKDRNILEYYFDITFLNGFDKDLNVPFYDDLYLDILVLNEEIIVKDEDEILEALNKNIINKKQFEFAYKIKDELCDELTNNINKYKNLNIVECLN